MPAMRRPDITMPNLSTLRLRRRPPVLNGTAVSPPQTPGAQPESESLDATEIRELRAERNRLREKFTIMQSDLGGAFYEMAIRDHVRMDVLISKAAELQKVDSELVVFERILKLKGTDAAGLCSGCGTPFHHGQQFCSQCAQPVGINPV